MATRVILVLEELQMWVIQNEKILCRITFKLATQNLIFPKSETKVKNEKWLEKGSQIGHKTYYWRNGPTDNKLTPSTLPCKQKTCTKNTIVILLWSTLFMHACLPLKPVPSEKAVFNLATDLGLKNRTENRSQICPLVFRTRKLNDGKKLAEGTARNATQFSMWKKTTHVCCYFIPFSSPSQHPKW